jgi:membrane protease YdiL (CAAX protease family)
MDTALSTPIFGTAAAGRRIRMQDAVSVPDLGPPPLVAPLPAAARPWQAHPTTQLAAALAVVLPLTASTVWFHLIREGPLTVKELLGYPLLFGGGLILWILALHRLLCGDDFINLGFQIARKWLDVVLGILLAAGFLIFKLVFHQAADGLFPPRPPVEELVNLLVELSRDPWLLALWLGPVVWVGVALFEELWRAFLLRRLWRVWGTSVGKWLAVLFSAIVFAFAHVYQGPAAMICIGIQSLLGGWFYMVTGRIWALIICHALFDSFQIIMAVLFIRQAIA